MGFMGYQGQDQRIREDSETNDTDHRNRLGGRRSSYTRKVARKLKRRQFEHPYSRNVVNRLLACREISAHVATCAVCQRRHENSTPGRNGRARSRRGRYFGLRHAKFDTKSNVPHTLVLAVLRNVALHRLCCDQETANCPEVFLSNPGEHVGRPHTFLSVLLE